MTSQQKISYLKRYRRIIQRIDRKYQEIQQWHDRAGLKAMQYSDMPRGGNGDNPIESAIENIVAAEQAIVGEIKELTELRKRIESAIENVEDETLRLLLELRYIDGKVFEQIAIDMSYSYMQITRLHGKALEAIKM